MAIEAPEAPQSTAPDEQVETLFRYSGWIHVGPGAETCEDIDEGVGTNDCSSTLHWHAWVRLPNQIQHEAIREKALAAKGRRVRQLKDPSTDAYDALECAMDELAAEGESIKESLVVELLDRERMAEYLQAANEVRDIEEVDDDAEEGDEPARPFAFVGADQDRLQELEQLPEADRGDEYAELQSHLTRYRDLVEEHHQAIHKPKVDELMAADLNDVIDRVRRLRTRTEGNAAFMNTYSRHEWLLCTLSQPHGTPKFRSVEQLADVAPEVFEALRATYDDLEQAQNEVVSGN